MKTFEEAVTEIEDAEKNVDKVLEAARLERHEAAPRYLNAEQKMEIIMVLILAFAVIGAFCLPVLWTWAGC